MGVVPLPNTRYMHPRWRQHHEPTVAETMGARVRLSHPGGLGTRNTTTGATPMLAAVAYYEGPGRVQSRTPQIAAASTGGREVHVGNYLVAVPVDLGGETPTLGDLVEVLECDDPLLVGADLVVVDIPTASILLQRNLGCDQQKPTKPGG